MHDVSGLIIKFLYEVASEILCKLAYCMKKCDGDKVRWKAVIMLPSKCESVYNNGGHVMQNIHTPVTLILDLAHPH
jgi:hypothetical protein